jgi:hypothetical protein
MTLQNAVSVDAIGTSTTPLPEHQQSLSVNGPSHGFEAARHPQPRQVPEQEQTTQMLNETPYTNAPATVRQLSAPIGTFPNYKVRYTTTRTSDDQGLQKQLEAYKSRLGKAQAHITNLEMYNSRLGGQAHARISQLEMCESHLEHAQAQIAHLQDERARMEDEREKLEADLQKLQQHVFRRFESPDWKPDSNADVRRKLGLLDTEVKKWSKLNCLSHLHLLKPDTHPRVHENLGNILHDLARLDNKTSFANVPDDKAWVLVQAYIMHSLYLDVFNHPFFGISIQQDRNVSPNDIKGDDMDVKIQVQPAASDLGESMRLLYRKFWTCKFSYFM